MRAGAPTVLIYLVVIAAIAGSIFLVARAWVVARAEQPLLDEARRIHEATATVGGRRSGHRGHRLTAAPLGVAR